MADGPSGNGLDDLFALEQDSLIPGTKVKTTGSFKAERDFDEARVKALINEINGMDSTGEAKAPVPTLFGMNFQAVSVGQKLPKAGPGDDAGLVGGYADAAGTPNNGLAEQLAYVDGALGELRRRCVDNNLSRLDPRHRRVQARPVADRSGDASRRSTMIPTPRCRATLSTSPTMRR